MTSVELLFGDAQTIEVKETSKKTFSKVEVPDSILKQVQEVYDHNLNAAKTNGKRRMLAWPITSAEQIDPMSAVLFSAADQLGCTVMVSPAILDDTANPPVYLRVKDASKATHIRVSVGQRRGKKVAGDGATEESGE